MHSQAFVFSMWMFTGLPMPGMFYKLAFRAGTQKQRQMVPQSREPINPASPSLFCSWSQCPPQDPCFQGQEVWDREAATCGAQWVTQGTCVALLLLCGWRQPNQRIINAAEALASSGGWCSAHGSPSCALQC